MFDVGWSEMLVIAIVLIVVVGPKDLPRMLRQFGRSTSKLRAMAGDFRRQFDEALKEAELDDVADTLSSVRKLNPMSEIRKHLAPIEEVGQQVRAGLDEAMKPQSKVTPAETAAEPVAAEPLKNGAAALPGEAAPKPKKTSVRAKAATTKTGAGRKTAAAKVSASAGVAAPVKTVAAKAPSKPAASRSPVTKAPVSKSPASKSAAPKTTAAKASKPAAVSANKGPAKASPSGRKKTGSTR